MSSTQKQIVYNRIKGVLPLRSLLIFFYLFPFPHKRYAYSRLNANLQWGVVYSIHLSHSMTVNLAIHFIGNSMNRNSNKDKNLK